MVKTLSVLLKISSVAGSVLYDPTTHVASPSTGCGKSSPYTVGKSTEVTGTYGGVKYTWRVYVPSSYSENTPMPLVTQHHGWGMTAKSEESGSGISIYAEQYGYIAVYPQGSDDNPNRGGPWYSWNAVGSTLSPGPNQATCTQQASNKQYCYDSCGQCSDKPQCWWTTCHDEVTPSGTGYSPVDGFVPSLYDTLESQLCIDTTREFAAGESNGGMMTYQLGVDMASRLAAVVAEFGSFHYQYAMSPKSSVPILSFHGTKDTTVPANVSLSGDGYYYTTVEDIFYGSQYSAGWRSANGCSGGDSHYPTSFDGEYSLYCVSTGQCTGGDVVRCSWNGGHNWYGNNAQSNGGLVSEFLMKWAKPSHAGFGRVQGEAKVEPKIMQNIEIVPDAEGPSFELPITVVPASNGHYGDPKTGCLDDEDVVELADGQVCMPIVGPAGDENGLPTPNCQIGGVGPQPGNGCPTDAPVSPGSKAFPLCVAKGNTTDPYSNGEFHCVLACPCTNLDKNGECPPESDSHCPQGGTCRLGELRHRGQGVCTYTGKVRSSIIV
jgi:poly(3-hydroxybutyrate) depolymerase